MKPKNIPHDVTPRLDTRGSYSGILFPATRCGRRALTAFYRVKNSPIEISGLFARKCLSVTRAAGMPENSGQSGKSYGTAIFARRFQASKPSCGVRSLRKQAAIFSIKLSAASAEQDNKPTAVPSPSNSPITTPPSLPSSATDEKNVVGIPFTASFLERFAA